MSTPDSTPTTRTVRVQTGTHAQLSALAERLNGTVDDAVQFLFQREQMIRVPVSDRQKERWQKSATQAGLSLPEFVQQCTESAVAYGVDRGAMILLFQHVHEMREMLRENLPQ